MAVVTWNGSSSTDFATAANWDTGSVPTASDDVIIPDTSSINKCVLDQARNINSFVLAPDGEFDAGNTLFIKGKNAAGEAIKAQGKLGDVTDFTIETASAATVILTKQSGSGSFRDLTINHASADITLAAAMSLGRNLTITAGELDTSGSNYALTVTGATTIGDGSASADTSTLTCNASTISLGSGVTGTHSLVVQVGGTFTGGSGTHTLGSLNIKNSTAAKCTLSSGNTTIDGEGSANKAINIEGSNGVTNFAHGSGTVIITHDGASDIKADGATLALNNLIINHASANINLKGILTVAGNLTITAGELDTTSSDHALTVTGYCDVTGTLTLNGSTVSVAALRCNSGAVVTQDSDGTLALATGSNFGGTEGSAYSLRNLDGTSDINLGGTTTVTGGSYFEPRTATVYASVLNNIVWNSNQYWVGEIKIGGTLVVNASKHLQPYGGSKNLTVVGDVTVNGALSAYPNGHTDLNTMTFKSLTINSGGEYAATTGTTNITGQHTASGMGFKNLGTFTHNNGLVKFTESVESFVYCQESNFYDLEVDLDSNTDEFRWLESGVGLTVYNNLTITSGRFKFNTSGDAITVHGLTNIIDGQFGLNSPSGVHTFNGLVTIEAGTWFLSSGTNNMAGIRNVGGTIS